ncbi:conserved hypothetical protein [Sphingobium sp. AP50]|uniref:EthD family reductase n=1 Tax=Sphingobium sp. AP50 TaxID=1884369 RepID=UPI0008BE1865|nr:EthD family reductase [Sphingobium sp. AP50]SEK00788.1 conserved hypothetical protein [Sphingobium sp. AP50]
MFSLFLTFVHPDAARRLSVREHDRVAALVRSVPGLHRAHLFTPDIARDRYFDDGPSPMLTLQLYFPQLQTLEAAAAEGGALASLFGGLFPSLAAAEVEQQAMWTRPFATPASDMPDDITPCSYLVHYPGQPEDLSVWLRYYFANHARIMGTFPGVLEVEVFSCVDWVSQLPARHVAYFQRNRIMFESAAALEGALNSPVREEMKADRALFPPFSGTNIHFPMATDTVFGPRFAPFARGDA